MLQFVDVLHLHLVDVFYTLFVWHFAPFLGQVYFSADKCTFLADRGNSSCHLPPMIASDRRFVDRMSIKKRYFGGF
jgi:hypothetical protein